MFILCLVVLLFCSIFAAQNEKQVDAKRLQNGCKATKKLSNEQIFFKKNQIK